MKILHTVEFYWPSLGGAQEVVRQISERLALRGHDVTVATRKLPQRTSTTINGVHVEEFSISGNETYGYQGETDRYTKFLTAGDFDLMMNYAAQQWATDLVYRVLDRIPYRKVLAPCGFSGLYNSRYTAYFRRMPAVMRQYDHLIFHSDITRDAEFARKSGITDYSLIPNGAAAEEFDDPVSDFRERYGILKDRPMLLTVGSHTGAKGHSLAIEAFRRAKIGPATLVIIGNTLVGGIGCLRRCRVQASFVRLASLGSKEVVLLDPPRTDVVAAYHAADLFLFGSNIECSPIVLFEAMASRTPFVSSAVGNAEEIANWGGGGLILPTYRRADGDVRVRASDMARALEDLLSNAPKRKALSEAGYQAWKQRFTWEGIAGQYERIYQRLAAES
jgi:glycosyltransferase involved in cell wall biosynthesis